MIQGVGLNKQKHLSITLTYLTNFQINDGGRLPNSKGVEEVIRNGVMRTGVQISERQAGINLEESKEEKNNQCTKKILTLYLQLQIKY